MKGRITKTNFLSILVLGITVLLSGCAGNFKNTSQENRYTDETIIDAATGKQIGYQQLLSKLEEADYILLGENHDNAWHHERQLSLVTDLIQRGWLKQLSLEMMTPGQQFGANKIVAERSNDVDKVKKALSWSERWDWKFYGPIVSFAVAEGVPLRSANLDRDTLMAIYRQADVLKLPDVLDKPALELTRKRIVDSHCGNIPDDRIDSMVMIQRARDDEMATSLLRAPTGSLLLAGNWHVRNDLGVPRYLAKAEPDKKVIALSFVEQDEEVESVDSLLSTEPYNVLWITPGVDRDIDLCGKPSEKK